MTTVPGTDIPKPFFNLDGQDGNAMMLIGGARKAMRRAGVSKDVLDIFSTEATSGDYDHVLQTVMAYATDDD